MSVPTKHRGRLSPRSVTAWKTAAHSGFVHSGPDSTIQTTNYPPPTSPRFPMSLNAALVRAPHLETTYVAEDWSDDCQIATQPVNRPAAVIKIASDRFDATDIGSGLIP